jgi:hypothetical protein
MLARSCRQRLASAPTSGAWQPNAHAGVAPAQLECSDNTVDMMDDEKSLPHAHSGKINASLS